MRNRLLLEQKRRSVLGLGLGLGLGGMLASASSLPPLRFGYFDRYGPLSSLVLDGRAVGLLVDRVDAVAREAGLQCEHYAFPWVRAQAMVADGRLDGLCSVQTPGRDRYALFGRETLLQDRNMLVHRIGDARSAGVQSLEDLKGLRLGTYRGNGFAQQYLGAASLVMDDSPDSVLRRIGLGDLDGFVEGEHLVQARLQKLGLSDRLMMTPLAFLPSVRFRVGLRRSLPEAAAVLERMDMVTLALRRANRLPIQV